MKFHIVASITYFTFVDARQMYQQRIPNGNQVPNPCSNGIWGPVGHTRADYPDGLNPFGAAFRANRLTWNATLCRSDSDGDGVSNGVELGDPNCVWQVGANPSGRPTGHPGICEPVTSDVCKAKNRFLNAQNCAPLASANAGRVAGTSKNATLPQIQWLRETYCTCFCVDETTIPDEWKSAMNRSARDNHEDDENEESHEDESAENDQSPTVMGRGNNGNRGSDNGRGRGNDRGGNRGGNPPSRNSPQQPADVRGGRGRESEQGPRPAMFQPPSTADDEDFQNVENQVFKHCQCACPKQQ